MRYPTCGAKTRLGTACGRPAGWGTPHAGEGRCKLHGGCSPRGLLHPRFRHGRFARYEVHVTAARVRDEAVMVRGGMLWFDAEGTCTGLAGVVTDGKLERYDPPRPLRPQDVEVLRNVPTSYTVTIRDRGAARGEA